MASHLTICGCLTSKTSVSYEQQTVLIMYPLVRAVGRNSFFNFAKSLLEYLVTPFRLQMSYGNSGLLLTDA